MSAKRYFRPLGHGWAGRLLIWGLLAGTGLALGQAPITERVLTEAHRQWVQAEFERWQGSFRDNADVTLRQGLLANRKTREIELLAAASGMREIDPVEFFVVTGVGKDYESLSVTTVSPRDLDEALRFIGMTPGVPVDPGAFRFWPRGERVKVTVGWEEKDEATGKVTPRSVAIEDLVWNVNTKQALPRTGWCYTGSVWREVEGKRLLEAEASGDVASTINYRWALLDVPYLAEQQPLYGKLVANPQLLLKIGTPLRLRLTPELPLGEKRVADFVLRVTAPAPTEAKALPLGVADLRFTLTRAGGDVLLDQVEFSPLLEKLGVLYEQKLDAFVQFMPGRELPVAPLPEFCTMLDAIAGRNIVRLDPAPGQLYYKAFMPDRRWLKREERLGQPIELHLEADGSAGYFFHLPEDLEDGKLKATEKRYDFRDAAELKKLIEGREDWETTTLFCYVAARAPYGRVLDYCLPLAARLPTVYVFPVAN